MPFAGEAYPRGVQHWNKMNARDRLPAAKEAAFRMVIWKPPFPAVNLPISTELHAWENSAAKSAIDIQNESGDEEFPV